MTVAAAKTTGRKGTTEVRVETAVDAAERRRVYAFGYRVLVEEMGAATAHAHGEERRLQDPLDEVARQLYLTRGARVEACLRLMIGAGFALPDYLAEAYALDRFSSFPQVALAFTDRLLIGREARTDGAAELLLGTAYRVARAEGARFVFTHAKPSQAEDYRRLGYRRLGEGFQDPELGFQSAHCLVLGDHARLGDVGSPLAAIASGFAADEAATTWFAENFPAAANTKLH